MSRVLAGIATDHDYRLVLLAALLCAAASFTSFHAYSYVTQDRGSRRMPLAFLTAILAAVGIWATHFVGMLAHASSHIATYDPVLSIASLLIAAVAAAAGFAIASRGGRPMVAGGGAVIGVGIALMHFTGLQALQIPGTVAWDHDLMLAAIATGILFGSAALLTWHELPRSWARWLAPVLLMSAICGLHLTAVAAMTIEVDPRIVVPRSSSSPALALAVCGVAGLMLLALMAMTLITGHAERDALARSQELVDAALDGLVVAHDGRIVNINSRIASLTGWSADELLGRRVAGDLLTGEVAGSPGQVVEASLATTHGIVAVEVVRRSLGSRVEANEVYTIRDLTERRRVEQALEAQNQTLDQALAKVAEQKADLDVALANMSQGLAMFDAEERLVLANARYAEIYGLEPRHLKPGTTLRELIDYRIARGLYPGMTADDVLANMRERLVRGNANELISKPGDGRTISVSIHPRSDGGWVTTLHDLTEGEALNTRLREQNSLLQQREEELAIQNARFDAAISNMSQGMCLFDAQQRIVFANDRYAELYRLGLEQVKPGTSIRQVFEARADERGHTGSERDDYVRRGLERFNRCASQTIRLTDGRFISVIRRHMPGGGLLSTHEDITERETLTAQLAQQNELLTQREHELNARNEQLDVAMNNMAQGLAMFDSNQRLIVCNRRYAEMYSHTAEQVKPGTSLQEIFEHRFANGLYPVSDKSDFIHSWASSFGEVSSRIQELSDGRVINVLRRRTGNGGRVITHEDITERQALHTRLEEQHSRLLEQDEHLRRQNLKLDAALNNMLQGLAMFDADLRLVMCNKRYAQMYGFAPEQVRPGTTLQSIIQHRIARGEFAGKNAEELIQGIIERSAGQELTHYTSRLIDGRYIAVSVQPMPDGGTVTTHHDITEQRRSEAKIAHMALHDTLTGLPNRVLLNERIDDALRRVKRGEIVATHLLDLDHFKTVNDTLGHPAGDSLLKSVADRLRSVVRETDTIARMGGDEFAIVQTGIAQPADATALAHRVIEAVSAPYMVEGHQVVIGTSVGIAVCPHDGTSHDQLIRNADLALYRAKGDGRGTYRFFEQEMDAQMQARRLVENDLRRALAAGEFELHYQPYVNLEHDEICGFEALVRWRHPAKGLISPGTFVPLAEEMGLIIPLGEWAIREACAAAVGWPCDLKVAVNLSPAQFKSPGLVQVVVNALATTGLPAERLELEITETTLMLDSEATLNMLYQMRSLGVRIALDDFGTGYSSLSLLQSFPFDKLKIDRSFVKDIADGVGSLNIVRAVTAMAAGLGMTTTAEGVETQEQLDTVRAEGCTEMQGFVFSRPIPAAAVAPFLRERHKGVGTAANAA